MPDIVAAISNYLGHLSLTLKRSFASHIEDFRVLYRVETFDASSPSTTS